MNYRSIQGSHIFKAAKAMQAIVRPLNDKLAIPHFKYAKIFKDGSRITLTNHPERVEFILTEWLEQTWTYNKKPDFVTKQQQKLWAVERLSNTPAQDCCETEVHRLFGFKDGITFIYNSTNHCELFDFGAADAHIYQIDPAQLQYFMLYFKSEAGKLMQRCLAEKIKFPFDDEPIKPKLTLPELPIKRFYLYGDYSDIYLTPREVECLKLIVQGRSLTDVAIILGISSRTAGHHIENIKRKLRVDNLYQAIHILTEQKIL